MRKLILVLVTGFFILFWLALQLEWFISWISYDNRDIFSSTYIIIALLGGIFGLWKAKLWGGFKSTLGKSLSLLSLGLLTTTAGSMVLSFYYYILETEPTYPSVAEVFYIAGIVFYILGVIFLAKTLRIAQFIARQSIVKKLAITLLPLLMIGLVLGIYLSQYGLNTDYGITLIATDLAYAILQATYAAIALAALFSSGQLYGGKLRKAITVLLIALLFQYFADTNYSFGNLVGNWETAGYGELLYLLAYALIAFSIQLFDPPKSKPKNVTEGGAV